MSTHARRGTWFLALLLSFKACSVVAAPLKPPLEALARMTKGGISLRAEVRPIGPDRAPILLHLWVVPTGRDPNVPVEPRDKNTPITRRDITTGASLKSSPFHLDVFARQGTKWRSINSVEFREDKDVQEIETRWLHPHERRGPVLALHFGYAHWHEWQLVIFPQGLGGPIKTQQFLWGGEGGSDIMQRLNRVDQRGVMMIEERSFALPNDKSETVFYNWSGAKFVDAARYFLIGATTKTEEEAAAWVHRNKLPNAYVHWTDDFPLLRHGYAVVVLGRYNSAEAAHRAQKAFRGRAFTTFVKRAF